MSGLAKRTEGPFSDPGPRGTGLPGELRIYTASTPSTWRWPWLMEDRMYRAGLVAASMGYFRSRS